MKLIPANIDLIDSFANKLGRTQLQYHEHSFITDTQLKEFFISKTQKILQNPNALCIAAFSGSNPMGLLTIVKDDFDSEMFGFNCYRIVDLLVLPEFTSDTLSIITGLFNEAEYQLVKKCDPSHFSCGINNNTENSDRIFNALTRSGFYYIHTLLTFSSGELTTEAKEFYPELNLTIRPVKNTDADQVAELAEKSFKLSRFHLDPYLNNEKAGHLLKTSAVNSILRGFADIMFVAEIKEKIIGYFSAKKRYIEEFGLIMGESIISAVDSKYQGLGVFTKLDHHIQYWFTQNTDFTEMGTYLANYPVHKTWIRKNLGLIRGTHQLSKYTTL